MIRLVLPFLLVFSATAALNRSNLKHPVARIILQRSIVLCRMSTGYPKKNFTIHGLWPAFHNGTFPSCDKNPPLPPASRYNESQTGAERKEAAESTLVSYKSAQGCELAESELVKEMLKADDDDDDDEEEEEEEEEMAGKFSLFQLDAFPDGILCS
ncbi:hypothetical protein MUK42_03484 [Musa troglodytarum]|uniref:Uncharacterized protein n=1 Tax=Musa troglodytarum TaxID=320322 RepID=A0A9E7GH68_9LILI|nr:hypothetical protein MUK42_03484 [Musa troglodytarum]